MSEMRADTFMGTVRIWIRLIVSLLMFGLMMWVGTTTGLTPRVAAIVWPDWFLLAVLVGGFAYFSIVDRLREINERLRDGGYALDDDPGAEDEL